MGFLFLSFFLVLSQIAPAGEGEIYGAPLDFMNFDGPQNDSDFESCQNSQNLTVRHIASLDLLPVKLFCFFTPEFQTLYERFFFPSIQDDFDVIVRQYPQECPSGIYRSEGWDKTMLRKLDMLHDAILGCAKNQILIYADVDIIFLKPALPTILECLGTHDFIVQQGWPRKALCAGFIVLRGNEKTLTWIQRARALLESKICPDDQQALQRSLESFRKEEISWAFLPSAQFPNGRRVLKSYSEKQKQLYARDSELVLDDSIVLFHANCCLGLKNKYHFLTRVQEEYLKNRGR